MLMEMIRMLKKDDLLELLEDRDVIEKIKSIMSVSSRMDINDNTEIDRLRERISVLESEKKVLESQITTLKQKNHTLTIEKKELIETQNQYSQSNELLQRETEQLKQELAKEQTLSINIKKSAGLYDRYLELSENIRISGLGNVISDKTVLSFMISCSDFDNLSSIWDYCKNMIQNASFSDAEISIIRDIFEYYFEETNNALPIAKYKLDDVRSSQEFDDELHIRGKDSRVSGRISEVLLRGYVQVNNGKRMRQSIVVVRD